MCYDSILSQKINDKIDNIDFQVINGKIDISYDIIADPADKYKVDLSLLRKSDTTFILIPHFLKGDVGNNISPGKNKIITWDISREIKGKLKGRDYYFKVTAIKIESSSSLYYYIGTGIALVGAGTTYYVITKPAIEKKNLGIPDPPERP